jgi:hypothetical protein
MEALKQAFAVVGAVVGVLTGLLTLYAKYLDVRKAVREENRGDQTAAVTATDPAVTATATRPVGPGPSPAPSAHAIPAPAPVDRVRALEVVKAPAIALMIAGGLGLIANVFFAGFGYIDEFVTPLTTTTQLRRAAAARVNDPEAGPVQVGQAKEDPEHTSAVLGMIALLSFSLPSALAAWAGFEMVRLRSYWVSVAGSIAVMPGACVCCLTGLPVGIWSLTVLFRPEVAEAFR